MQKALIGKKIGMTQIFDANGNVVPVTVVEAGPCSVVMKKTVENDGYEAVLPVPDWLMDIRYSFELIYMYMKTYWKTLTNL